MQFVLQKERQEADRKAIEAEGIAAFQKIGKTSLKNKNWGTNRFLSNSTNCFLSEFDQMQFARLRRIPVASNARAHKTTHANTSTHASTQTRSRSNAQT